jgi:hypothetical protein
MLLDRLEKQVATSDYDEGSEGIDKLQPWLDHFLVLISDLKLLYRGKKEDNL